MAVVAVSNIKIGKPGEGGRRGSVRIIKAGDTLKKGDVDEDTLKQLVALGVVAPPKSPTAEDAKQQAADLEEASRRVQEAEAQAAESARIRAELEAQLQDIQAKHEEEMAEAIAKAVADANPNQ
jgi:molecular chaperone GrpE (heat shock protein)